MDKYDHYGASIQTFSRTPAHTGAAVPATFSAAFHIFTADTFGPVQMIVIVKTGDPSCEKPTPGAHASPGTPGFRVV